MAETNKPAESKNTKSAPKALKDGRRAYTFVGRSHDGVDEEGNRKTYTTNDTVYLTEDQYRNFRSVFLDPEADDKPDANQVKDGSIIGYTPTNILSSEQLLAEQEAVVFADPHEPPSAEEVQGMTNRISTAEATSAAGATAPQVDDGNTGVRPPVKARTEGGGEPKKTDKVDVKTGSPTVVGNKTK
jgi:hypothetical protein